MENLDETTGENMEETTDVVKQRHGCVTAWLVFMIVGNSLVALLYFFATHFFATHSNASPDMMLLLGVLCIANVVFAVLLLKWNKWGFWGYTITGIGALIINLSIGISIAQCVLGLAGIAVLYGILQIKEGDSSAWDNLE